ncbi:MAG: periplasmic heavy metal sensor [Bacteroidia bacterium]
MESAKFLKTVVIILLLINIGTLAFMWFDKPHHGPPPPHEGGDAMEFLSRELKFSDAQQKQFEELREQHHDAVEPLQKASRKLHDQYFNMLADANTDSLTIVQVADSMIAVQKQIELKTYYHFKSVRAICTPEQQKKFDDVIADALHQMARKPPGVRGR